MTSAPQSSTRAYFPYVDGLRGVSIVAVLLYHLDIGLLPAGFSGVDIFFVISGFVVSASLHGIAFDRFRDLALFFYARRLRRVVPGLVVVLLVSSLFAVLFIPFGYLSSQIRETGLAAFLGISNVVLAFDANGYFAPRAEFNPFTHTWSLGVEEQFYLVFPLLFFAFLKSQRSRAIGLACLLCLMVLSVGYCLVEDNSTFRFYMIFGRFWELATGVCLYLFLEHNRDRATRRAGADENRMLSYLGAVLIGAGFFVAPSEQFPLPGGLMPVAGTALLILGLHGRVPRSWIARLLATRPLVGIGLLSYSLYLWHWPVFVLFRWTIGFETPGQKIVALAIAVLLAITSYQLVERPFRTSRLLRLPKAAIAGSVLFAMCCGVTSYVIFDETQTISRSVVMQHRDDWYPHQDFATQRANGCRIERSQSVQQGITVAIITPISCSAANPDFTLFAVGDSHAYAYWSMLGAYALATGHRVAIYTAPGCPTIEFASAAEHCKATTARALADIRKKARRGDIVLLSSLYLPRLRQQWDAQEIDVAARIAAHVAAGIRPDAVDQALADLGQLQDAGLTIVFELPKPTFPTPLFRCSDWFNRTNPTCRDAQELKRALLQEYRRPVVQAADLMAARLPALHLWDPFAVLCPDEPCRMTRDGKPLYLDGDHISAYANLLLLPSFSAMIETVRKAPAPQ
jgi:peptidoglycan/LPS O-acetylase OafA/YrhL